MRTLILNASPRPNGTIARMMALCGETAGEGTSSFDLCRMNIRPCTGCMACRKTGHCRLPYDDAHRVAELLRRADLLVVGTPVYWANMNGSLKVLFDRLVPVLMEENRFGFPKGKLRSCRAIVVTACSTPFPFDRLFGQSGGALRAVKEVLRSGGMKVDAIRIPGTKTRKGLPECAVSRLSRRITQIRSRLESRKGR